MDIVNIINENNLTEFNSVKKFFKSEPYNLIVRENKNLYLLQKNKLPDNFSSDICFKCNGIILEKETNKIICYGTNCLRTINDFEELNSFNKDTLSFEKYYDGTLIKVFYHEGKWNYSTNGYINAFDSYWISEKSFGELFMECVEDNFENRLEKGNCYSFILIHPDNRHVVNNNEKKIIHISTRNLDTLEEIDVDIDIDKSEKINIDFDNLKEKFNSLDYNNPGYIVYDNFQNKYILTNSEFNKVKEIRGNYNNIDKICINSILNNDKNILVYYPEYEDKYTENKNKIVELLKTIFILYRERHMYKKFKVLPPKTHYMINNIHQYYKSKRKNITKDLIMEILKEYIDDTYSLIYQKN